MLPKTHYLSSSNSDPDPVQDGFGKMLGGTVGE
jgi:hypothetical protein